MLRKFRKIASMMLQAVKPNTEGCFLGCGQRAAWCIPRRDPAKGGRQAGKDPRDDAMVEAMIAQRTSRRRKVRATLWAKADSCSVHSDTPKPRGEWDR